MVVKTEREREREKKEISMEDCNWLLPDEAADSARCMGLCMRTVHMLFNNPACK